MDRIDFLGANGQGQGSVAQHIMTMGKMDPSSMRPFVDDKGRAMISVFTGGDRNDIKCYKNIPVNNATLRRDEWKQLDDALVQVSRERLTGFQDLIDNGLVYNLGNAMGTTVLESHSISDAFDAELTMDGVARSKNDRQKFSTTYLPIPIIHVDYNINMRILEASRKLGNPLDTTQAENATRKVNERLEKMLFTNTSYSFGGGVIYSYLNHPNRNLHTITAWDASGKTGAQIIADVLAMKQKAIAALHYGPYMLYVPTGYETVLDADYDATTPGTTIRERILKISGIKGIKTVDFLTANNVLLVQMTSDTVRLVQGLGISNVEWKAEGNMITQYKVMRISVPQIRSDYNDKSGIVHASV